MDIQRPKSINVISGMYIVLSALGMWSAVNYLRLHDEQDKIFTVLFSVLAFLLALFYFVSAICLAGRISLGRKCLEYGTVFLMVVLVGGILALSVKNRATGSAVGFVWVAPLMFIYKALKNEKTVKYMHARTVNRKNVND